MDTKIFLYGVFVGVLVAGLVGVCTINSLNGRIDELQSNLTDTNSKLGLRETEVETLQTRLLTVELTSEVLSATINTLEDSFTASQLNGSRLKAETRMLYTNITELQEHIILLDKAITVIGRGEIENVLWAYSEALIEMEELHRKYDELQSDYLALLSEQQGNP